MADRDLRELKKEWYKVCIILKSSKHDLSKIKIIPKENTNNCIETIDK